MILSLRINVRAGPACDALRYRLRCVGARGGICICKCFDGFAASCNRCSTSSFFLGSQTERQADRRTGAAVLTTNLGKASLMPLTGVLCLNVR